MLLESASRPFDVVQMKEQKDGMGNSMTRTKQGLGGGHGGRGTRTRRDASDALLARQERIKRRGIPGVAGREWGMCQAQPHGQRPPRTQ